MHVQYNNHSFILCTADVCSSSVPTLLSFWNLTIQKKTPWHTVYFQMCGFKLMLWFLVPQEGDLDALPVLTVGEKEMKTWSKHLRNVTRISHSFKQRLLSALAVAVHQSEGRVLPELACTEWQKACSAPPTQKICWSMICWENIDLFICSWVCNYLLLIWCWA